MIYPTARAVGLAAAGVPVAMAVALLAPQDWLIGPTWVLTVFALALIDAGLSPRRRRARLTLTAPAAMSSNATDGEALVDIAFDRGAPGTVQVSLDSNDRLRVEPQRAMSRTRDGGARLRFSLTPVRRGRGLLPRVWARWRGPLGLTWKQMTDPADCEVALTLDIRGIKDEAMRLFSRNTLTGARMQRDLGGGSEFHALRDFQTGMDRRTIDWKRSARHGALLAKEFRAERNHTVMLVLDTGRLMCEPVAGAPRIDHALNAALLLAFVSLKAGDRVGLFAFDAKPKVAAAALSGTHAFAHLQQLTAQIDYSTEETNFTLGLTQLNANLRRRSLLVIFTDFADATSAELMLENVGRLLTQHLVLFVVMRDQELEDLERHAPDTPEDVSRAAVAAAMTQERDVVIERVRRLGAHVVEAPVSGIGPALLSRYLELKRRDLL